MDFGYSRISTKKQDHSRQIEQLTRFGVDPANIEQEIISGTHKNKPIFTQLLAKMREGDRLIVEEFSRIGRSTRHVLDIIETLDQKGVEFVSLSERIETKTPMGRLMVTFLAALCEFEAAITRERVLEGLEVAKQNGKQLGRPKLDKKLLDNAVRMYQDRSSCSVRDIAVMSKVSVGSLYRALHDRGLLGDSK
jgi:DNA invertase Pin-like site-specific DNA recombinase